MRRLFTASAVCALAIGVVVTPALAKKAPKLVGGTVSVNVTPAAVTPGDSTTTVAASGNLASNSSCRKDRMVRFSYVEGATVTPLAETTVTRSNGDWAVTLPEPASSDPATSHAVVLRASVDEVIRKVGGKKKSKRHKKGRVFDCLALTGDSSPITVTPAF